mgnify:CR=1 FL=1
MKVLGIDPGYGRCGMAIVSRDGTTDTLIESLCVETSSTADFPTRLSQILTECSRLLDNHAPDAVAIEKLFFSKSRTTAMRVAEVRGALIGCAGNRGTQVFEYSPAEVKSATTGFGGADKRQIAAMLRMTMKIEKDIRLDDEFDAIAIAVTHLSMVRMNSLAGQSALQ